MKPRSSLIERQITNLIRSYVDTDLIEDRPLSGLGSPDLASTYAKVAVFVDGCHWHGCREHTKDDERAAERRARDERVNATLKEKGWVTLRVWEHEEWLSSFLTRAATTIADRASERRRQVLAHIASHAPGEWCGSCDGWPHEPLPDGADRCARCTAPLNDHEPDAVTLKLFGPVRPDEEPST